MNRVKRRLLALRFELAARRFERGFKKDVAKEKNRYIDEQIAAWRSSGSLSKTAEFTHAANLDRIFRANVARIIKAAVSLAPSMVGGLKSIAPLETKRNLHDEALRAFFIKRGGQQVKKTADTTTADVSRLLREAFDNGEPEDEVLKSGLRAKGLSPFRAETIARTETHSAAQFASDFSTRQMAVDAGVTLEKAWLPVDDDRTREAHADMDGDDWIGDDEYFDVNGEQMLYPSATGASAENTINCRCQLLKRVAGFSED
jgi:hypothetical protein